MIKRLLFAFTLLAVPAVADAQSLFGTRGLGVPADGYDARARALGSNGVGLLGLSTSLVNPAETAGLLRRGVSAAFQPWSGTSEFDGQEDDVAGTRFPMVRILYPTRFGSFSLGYGGVLDQSWAVFANGVDVIGNDTVATRDLVQNVGGIGQVRLGFARNISQNLALGVAVGVYTGNLDRGISREFPDTSLGLVGFETHSRWNYSGPLAAVGMRWDPMPDLRVGASVTWSGTLTAKPQEGATTTYEYDMPMRFHVGASGRVARNLVAAVSGSFTTWTSDDYRTPGEAAAGAAELQKEVGVGLEYSELRRGNRIFPLRLGARTSQLPFHNVNEEVPSEWAITGGIGLRLVEDEFGPLAVADIGFERGSRKGLERTGGPALEIDSPLEESFLRFTVSISLFGR